MATSTGAISGGSSIDAQTLARQLIEVERAPFDAQIKRATESTTTTLSALGTLKSALSTFQASVEGLSLLADFQVRSATSSKPEVFTASATEGAVAGSYSVQVHNLATAHQISSAAYVGGNASLVGSGTLTLSVGGESFDVTVEADDTLANLRDAINSSRDNTGINATIVQSSAGARLVLSSRETGAANVISTSVANGAGGLDALAYSNAVPGSFTSLTAAQDALVDVAGFAQTSATNTITNAIDGVTLNLVAGDAGEVHTLTIANDTAVIKTRIETFVATYNAMQTAISGLRSYDAATETGGPLLGDSMLLTLESRLRRGLTDAVSGLTGNFTSLSSLGITTTANGTLAIDDATLSSAITADFDGVAQLFGKTGGVAFRLYNTLDDALASDGGIAIRTKSLSAEQSRIEDRSDDLDARMEAALARYVQQFTTLDVLLSTLNTTSSYLDQQLDSLANMFRKD